ncbi:MAG: hypothetical protein RMK29_05655 [Myxococcales bacterium]|nr:hypothetical protein [Myxococcota bacterium]MDW8281175.1 hypothetical protein [Myxococcales bacterium]
MQRLLAALLLLSLVGSVSAQAGKKTKKKSRLPPQATLGDALNARRDEIQDCAIRFALDRGARRVDIVTRLTINGRGQVLDNRTTVNVVGGDGEQVRACVERVIGGIRFPATEAPLITIERNWSVAAQ